MSSLRHSKPKARGATALVALLVTLGLAISTMPAMPAAHAADERPWLNTSYSFEERAALLVSRMTTAEKIRQLSDKPVAITRLGLSSYNYWNEALHGVVASGTTMFPSATGIASSWNRGLVSKIGNVIGDEARVLNRSSADGGSAKGLTYWSPTLNIYRDPRWGRADESYGEDPYFVGQVGEQFVKGVQGTRTDYLKAISTPKHFFANNSESNRRNGNSEVTERELREYYTPAFAHALSPEVGAYSFMTAYNRVNGVPMSASSEYLETLAKRTWGFKGYVTTDCSAIQDVYNRHKWQPEGWDHNVDAPEATAWTLKAGSSMDCQGNTYTNFLQAAYDRGLITDAELDSELTLLLSGRFRLGEFDPKEKVVYAGPDYTRDQKFATAEHQAVALQASREAPVLLKNDFVTTATTGAPTTAGRGLPIESGAQKVAIVGYRGNTFVAGGYSGSNPVDNRTLVQAVTQVAKTVNPAMEIKYVTDGVTPAGSSGKPGVRGVVFKKDGVVSKNIFAIATSNGYPLSLTDNPAPDQFIKWEGWQGINWDTNSYMGASSVWGGYFVVRANLDTMGGLPNQVCVGQSGSATAVPKGAVFDVYLDAMNGTKVATVKAEGDASNCVTYSGGSSGLNGVVLPSVTHNNTHNADLTNLPAGGIHDFYFVWNPGTLGTDGQQGTAGKPWALKMSTTDEDYIKSADVVVVAIGTQNNESAEEMDRVNIDLPRFQDDLVTKVATLNPRTVVWMESVGQMNIEKFRTNKRVPSIVWANYNGQSSGIAAAEILFGKTNPSGKLPFTWYSNLSQLGSVWDYSITPGDTGATDYGRTYQYFTGATSYPFGFGLSYSDFSFSNLKLDKSSYSGDDTVTATVDVTNTSTVPGQAVVQLYVTAPNSDGINRPRRQLKEYDKVALGAMATKTVTLKVPAEDLWFWDDAADKAVWDKGTWKLQVGPQANSGPSTTFKLTGAPTPYLDVVAAVSDGQTLNIAAPDTVIHANLSASRNDQTFLDLESTDVKVAYSSSNPDVAVVDANGAVSAVGEGAATITATVTALGSTKSDSFPVVVNGEDAPSPVINMADQKVELPNADAVEMNASLALVPDGATTSLTYLIAPMDGNSAGATITADGVLTATQEGKVRVTALGVVDGKSVSSSAEVTVVAEGALAPDNSALAAAIAAAEALAAAATPESVASSGLADAIAAAKAALAADNQKALDAAVAALAAAAEQAQASLVMVDTPSAKAALLRALDTAIAQAKAVDSSRYTAASYKALQAAIAAAEKVAADPAATVAQLHAANDALIAALRALAGYSGEGVTVPRIALDAAGAKFTVEDKAYTGKKIQSGFAVIFNDRRLYEGVDFTVNATSGSTAIGKGKVTIHGKGDYSGTKVLSFKIVPSSTKVTKAKAGKKLVKVAYAKVSAAQKVSKYEVQYRVKGASSWKTKALSASKSGVTIKKLTKGKVYEVKVRSFKTISGEKYYSPWSPVKASKKVK